MVNVAVVLFDVESEGYQAFSEMKKVDLSADLAVSQAALVKKVEDRIVPLEWGDTGINSTDDTRWGGLIGLTVGIIGGPLGMLLGASYGALVGSTIDAADSFDEKSMIEIVAGKLYEDEVAIIALVQEEDETVFEQIFSNFNCQIIRFDAEDVALQVEEARKTELELQRQALAEMHAQKKADREKKLAERRELMEAGLAEFNSDR